MKRLLVSLLTSPRWLVIIVLPIVLGSAAIVLLPRDRESPTYASDLERHITWQCDLRSQRLASRARPSAHLDPVETKRRLGACYCFAHGLHAKLTWKELGALDTKSLSDPRVSKIMYAELERCQVPIETYFLVNK